MNYPFSSNPFIHNREIELRENLIGTGFIEPPMVQLKKAGQDALDRLYEGMDHRVTAIGEITKATGF